MLENKILVTNQKVILLDSENKINKILSVYLYKDGTLILKVKNEDIKLQDTYNARIVYNSTNYNFKFKVVKCWKNEKGTFYGAKITKKLEKEQQRLFDRIALDGEVHIYIKNKKLNIKARAVDISELGLGAIADVFISDNEEIQCKFSLTTGSEFVYDAIVSQSKMLEHGYRYSIKFTDTSIEDYDKAYDFSVELLKHKKTKTT